MEIRPHWIEIKCPKCGEDTFIRIRYDEFSDPKYAKDYCAKGDCDALIRFEVNWKVTKEVVATTDPELLIDLNEIFEN